jgi:hypothetical protein
MDWVIERPPEDTISFDSEAKGLRRCFEDRVAQVLRRIFAGSLLANRVDYLLVAACCYLLPWCLLNCSDYAEN